MPISTPHAHAPMCVRHARALARLAAVGLLLPGACAQAHTFCVDTAAELQNALTDASTGGPYAGENNFVNIELGTYLTGAATGNQPFHYVSTASTGSLTVTGGYLTGCPALVPKATLTTLDGNGTTQVLSLRSAGQPLLVRFLTLQNGRSLNSSFSGGLGVNEVSGDSSSVRLEDLIIQNNYSAGAGAGLRAYARGAGHQLLLQNSLITGNNSGIALSAGYVVCDASNGASLYNNTIVKNVGSGPASGTFYYGGTANALIAKNIIWNNGFGGLSLGSSTVTLVYNDYEALLGTPPQTNASNVSLDPQFVAPTTGNFHLSAASTLIGRSPQYSQGLDLDGRVLALDGLGDLGAYAETIFSDGF